MIEKTKKEGLCRNKQNGLTAQNVLEFSNKEIGEDMIIEINALACAKAMFYAEKVEEEVSAMGIFRVSNGNIVLDDLVLIKQEVSVVSIKLDMASWDSKMTEICDSGEIQPWQTSCWFHTHPKGCCQPSGHDHKTFKEDYGECAISVMLIMEKSGKWYGEVQTCQNIGGEKLLLNRVCDVVTNWAGISVHEFEKLDLQSLEKQMKELLSPRHQFGSSASRIVSQSFGESGYAQEGFGNGGPDWNFGDVDNYSDAIARCSMCQQERIIPYGDSLGQCEYCENGNYEIISYIDSDEPESLYLACGFCGQEWVASPDSDEFQSGGLPDISKMTCVACHKIGLVSEI